MSERLWVIFDQDGYPRHVETEESAKNFARGFFGREPKPEEFREYVAASKLDALQAAVRSYLNATELDEPTAAWCLLSGALANSGAVVERRAPK